MRQPETKKSCQNNEGQQEVEELNSSRAFLQCLELILPWLTSQELANVSLTSKSLNQISKSITHRRSSDASRSSENLPIPFQNTADDRPYAYFIYTPSQILPSFASQFRRQSWGSGGSSAGPNSAGRLCVEPVSLVDELGESVSGCDCQSCEDDDRCPCIGLNGSDVASECGPSCGCGLECRKRLTQRGVSLRLKIVRDRRKGWGLFADQFIGKGQFVCEYAGELLTTKEATRRQEMYDERLSGAHLSSALLVLREHLPSGKACIRMNIDATRIGNVARFINHSCDGGNLSTKLVRSTAALLPRICFFSSRDIKENEELSFSYGETRLRSNGLQCFCGSSCCFGTLPSEHT
ncbi:hypothetical protein FH972_017703 [Carpinus fangiana]|uniref:SET domain-containing protein n=1 Tax=Carpinus fangiana TaxID=176857 RepID=A0A5N6RMQ6_9ROSI|nr:hypothetical protein FH972_017703 [Carpinus fangiana]